MIIRWKIRAQRPKPPTADLKSIFPPETPGPGRSFCCSRFKNDASAATSLYRTSKPAGLLGFGIFSVSERPQRTGRNPETGGTIQIATGKAVKFKPGKGAERGGAVGMGCPRACSCLQPTNFYQIFWMICSG